MTRNRWILLAAVVVALVGVWYLKRGGDAPAVIDFVQTLPQAVKNMPAGGSADVFSVKDERIAGVTRRAINVFPPTRITWKNVVVPNDAWLHAWMGVDEQAWDKDGDGVLFFISITDNGKNEVLLNQRINPRAARGDRRWVPVSLDLSPYAGHSVEIIFNTRPSLPGGNDTRNDFAYWGAPAISLRP